MRSYNRVVLIGNLTRDPEIVNFQSGTSAANITLAVNDRRKDKEGNYVDETSYIDVTCWGRMGEIVEQYAGKGSQVLVEGHLRQESWEKEGKKFSRIKVVAERVLLMDGGPRQGQNQNQGNGNYNSNGGNNNGYRRQSNGYNNGANNGGGNRSYSGNGGNSYQRNNNNRQDDFMTTADDENIPF